MRLRCAKKKGKVEFIHFHSEFIQLVMSLLYLFTWTACLFLCVRFHGYCCTVQRATARSVHVTSILWKSSTWRRNESTWRRVERCVHTPLSIQINSAASHTHTHTHTRTHDSRTHAQTHTVKSRIQLRKRFWGGLLPGWGLLSGGLISEIKNAFWNALTENYSNTCLLIIHTELVSVQDRFSLCKSSSIKYYGQWTVISVNLKQQGGGGGGGGGYVRRSVSKPEVIFRCCHTIAKKYSQISSNSQSTFLDVIALVSANTASTLAANSCASCSDTWTKEANLMNLIVQGFDEKDVWAREWRV